MKPRIRAAAVLGLCLAWLAICCASVQPTAEEAKAEADCLSPIETRYALAVIDACPDRATRKACYAAHPELGADRRAAELDAGCR